jgi:hypothetical protein
MAAWLTVQAWTELLYLDCVGLLGFRALKQVVAAQPRGTALAETATIAAVDEAVRTAIVAYVKPVMCLQRSAAVTRLLRRRGIPAEVVIGCHLAPRRGHAWVEVSGAVIGKELEDLEYFCVLDRW